MVRKSDTKCAESYPSGVASVPGNIVVPATISGAGRHAVRRSLNFFAATIRDRNTREAYHRGCMLILFLLEQHDIGASRTISAQGTICRGSKADLHRVRIAAYDSHGGSTRASQMPK